MQPRFDILAAKPEQSPQLDARRKVATAGMTVVDGLLCNTQSRRQFFGRKKGIHVLRSYVMQSRDCPEYRNRFIAYFAEAALIEMPLPTSATHCGCQATLPSEDDAHGGDFSLTITDMAGMAPAGAKLGEGVDFAADGWTLTELGKPGCATARRTNATISASVGL